LKPIFSRTLILVALLCVSFTAVQAAEVRLADGQLTVAGVDDSIGLGAFDVVLSYGPDVSIISVEGLPGFLVASNILNDEGMTIIAGISADGLTGDVPVASVAVEGTGSIAIAVRELANSRGDPIPFTNPAFGGTTPTPVPPTPGSTSGSGSSVTSEGGGSVSTPALTPTSTTTAAPGETPQAVETGSTPAVTAATTTAAQAGATTQPLESPEAGETAGSTPKAGLPVLIALFSVMIVVVLNRKD